MVSKIVTLVAALGFIQATMAATGHVHINGVEIRKPSGCINTEPIQFSINQFTQISIENQSNKIAHVFEESNCNGRAKLIIPGKKYLDSFGKSIYIE
ncbi:unnamed protein product [Cunninghamella blakesleeana]